MVGKLVTFGFASLGLLHTLYTAITAAWPSTKDFLDCYYDNFLIIAIGIAVLLAIRESLALNRLEIFKLGQDSLTVRFGDLSQDFSALRNANFLIPVNDFFDTTRGKVIADESVHGQFLLWCESNKHIPTLRKAISNGLRTHRVIGRCFSKPGNRNRYDRDAQAAVVLGNNNFLLMPTSVMNCATLSVKTDWADYPNIIRQMCTFISNSGNGRVTLVPLIGDQLARTGIISSVLLEQLVHSISKVSREQPIGSPIEIVLYDQQRDSFDLRALKVWCRASGIS